jgi:hypothetical protein
MNFETLETEALMLNPNARARLAEKLLQSLEALSDVENEQLWSEEAQRRHQELTAGTVMDRPAEEMLSEARARLA